MQKKKVTFDYKLYSYKDFRCKKIFKYDNIFDHYSVCFSTILLEKFYLMQTWKNHAKMLIFVGFL